MTRNANEIFSWNVIWPRYSQMVLSCIFRKRSKRRQWAWKREKVQIIIMYWLAEKEAKKRTRQSEKRRMGRKSFYFDILTINLKRLLRVSVYVSMLLLPCIMIDVPITSIKLCYTTIEHNSYAFCQIANVYVMDIFVVCMCDVSVFL